MRWIVPVLIVGLFVGLYGVAPGAQASTEQDLARDAHRRGEIMSLGDIMRNVKQRVDGRIISTHFSTSQGGRVTHVYTFEILSENGDLMRIHVDASNARVLQIQRQQQRPAYTNKMRQDAVQRTQGPR